MASVNTQACFSCVVYCQVGLSVDLLYVRARRKVFFCWKMSLSVQTSVQWFEIQHARVFVFCFSIRGTSRAVHFSQPRPLLLCTRQRLLRCRRHTAATRCQTRPPPIWCPHRSTTTVWTIHRSTRYGRHLGFFSHPPPLALPYINAKERKWSVLHVDVWRV